MRKIYKYEIGVADEQFIPMPKGAVLLSCQMQKGVPCIWALVDPAAGLIPKRIVTYGTGVPILDDSQNLEYIGTYQMMEGELVWHVFERI